MSAQPGRRPRARVPSVLLALTGLAVVAIQTYVFISLGQFRDSYSPFSIYNGVAIASGAASCLTGFIGFGCTSPKRSASAFCFSALAGLLAAICSAASAALTAIESSKIHSNDTGHPCAVATDGSVDCELWFALEVAVAALSVFSFVLSVTLFIVIMAGSSKSKKTGRSDVQRPAEVVREMEHIPASQPVIVMPVIVEEVYKEMEAEPEPEEPEPEPEPEEEPETSATAGRQPYIEQLRMLSREELERRLGEHMQHQFLEELRTELNRRNLIPINGRSSSSSVKSAAKVPAAPRPDYNQEFL